MTTLEKLNFETASLAGLRVRGRRHPGRDRFAVIVENDRGAVELWSEQSLPSVQRITGDSTFGAVEVHSPRPLPYDEGAATIEHCEILGGPCWTDGSSLAYREQFLPLIKSGDTATILRELASWHESSFGGAS